MPTTTGPASPSRGSRGAGHVGLAAPAVVGAVLAFLGLWVCLLAVWQSAGCSTRISYGVEGVTRQSPVTVAVWEWGVDWFTPLWLPIVAPLLGWAVASAVGGRDAARVGAWVGLARVVMWDVFLLGGGCTG